MKGYFKLCVSVCADMSFVCLYVCLRVFVTTGQWYYPNIVLMKIKTNKRQLERKNFGKERREKNKGREKDKRKIEREEK